MKLYFSKGACSLAAHILLEELGIPYTTQQLDFDQHENETPEYLKKNPLGQVPVLEFDDGSVLTENGAVLPYLADLKPELKLLPPYGSMERYRAMEWLAFLGTELHKAFGPLFGSYSFVKSEEAQQEIQKATHGHIQDLMDQVEGKLAAKGPYILGANYSACDLYAMVFFNWTRFLKFDLRRWPKYHELVHLVSDRPAARRAFEAEGLRRKS